MAVEKEQLKGQTQILNFKVISALLCERGRSMLELQAGMSVSFRGNGLGRKTKVLNRITCLGFLT